MNKFKIAFDQTRTDKSSEHGYHRWYAEVFRDYEPSTLLEVGVCEGRSLAAWKLIFPLCNITGVDITDRQLKPLFINASEAKIVIGDTTQLNITQQLEPNYDVIIDDGSHFYQDIIKTFGNLKDRFNYAYVIEDAMYNHDLIIDTIKEAGYANIRVYDSLRQNVPVDTKWLQMGVYSEHRNFHNSTYTDLKLIVVFKD